VVIGNPLIVHESFAWKAVAGAWTQQGCGMTQHGYVMTQQVRAASRMRCWDHVRGGVWGRKLVGDTECCIITTTF
jgi:hypothetical protein